jgi:prepilin-type N-terminal cleavage/methylation domain-containing protein/prepilin-type processing-associated H-X9-DG protein
MNARSRAAGFTLLELLVVIALLAILASLLLPGLARAKALARSAQCQSRLGQFGIAFRMYLNDFEVYPDNVGALEPYLVTYLKPTTVVTGSGTTINAVTLADWYVCPLKLHYEYNRLGSAPYYDESRESFGLILDKFTGTTAREASVVAPSNLMLMGDATVSGYQKAATDPMFVGGMHFRPDYRHRRAANLLLADGHSESGKRSVWEARTDSARRRWNRDNLPHLEHFKN